jgi:hypothetical protein
VTKKLRRLFPRLSGNAYQLKSPKARRYNCLAWAAGHNDAWWDAALGGTWPEGVPDDGSVEAAVYLYERLGYTRATDATYEEGVEKIAIYGDDMGYTHAARQLPDGRLTSKIGKLQDIEHDALENLVDSRYGQVRQIMEKRPGGNPAATPPPA